MQRSAPQAFAPEGMPGRPGADGVQRDASRLAPPTAPSVGTAHHPATKSRRLHYRPPASPMAVGDRSGSVVAAVSHFHIGELGMVRTVRLSRHRLRIAEAEIPGARFPDRPAAGDDPAIGAWWRRSDPRWRRRHRPWRGAGRGRNRPRCRLGRRGTNAGAGKWGQSRTGETPYRRSL